MDELISKKDLFEKTAEWEAQAWDMVDKYSPDNDPKNNWEEWYKWSSILRERIGFKHTVMDAPTIIEMPDTGIGDLSDGCHTFNGLYEQRAILFAALVKAYKDKSWKSHRHEDGELCFGGGWFIVGIDTPKGSYTYHYEDKYWDMFDCDELERGKHWDGHTEKDAKDRLLSLSRTGVWVEGKWTDEDIRYNDRSYKCSICGHVVPYPSKYCGGCQAEMREKYEI